MGCSMLEVTRILKFVILFTLCCFFHIVQFQNILTMQVSVSSKCLTLTHKHTQMMGKKRINHSQTIGHVGLMLLYNFILMFICLSNSLPLHWLPRDLQQDAWKWQEKVRQTFEKLVICYVEVLVGLQWIVQNGEGVLMSSTTTIFL